MRKKPSSQAANVPSKSRLSGFSQLTDLFDVPGVPSRHCILDALSQFLFRGLLEALEGIQGTKEFVAGLDRKSVV